MEKLCGKDKDMREEKGSWKKRKEKKNRVTQMSLHKSNIVRNGGHSYRSCMITITNYNMVTFDRSLLERAHEIALSSLFLEIRFLPLLFIKSHQN